MTASDHPDRWNKIYQDGVWDYLSTDPAELNRLQIVSGWIDRFGGPRVLDVGCGKGQLLGLLNPAKVKRYVGLDASRIALDQFEARRDIPSAVRVRDLQSGPPADIGMVDCLCFIDVLQYVPAPAAILGSYCEMLSSSGVVITCHYIRPERVTAGASLWEVMTAEPDGPIEQDAIDEVLDAVTLVSMTRPRRWHMKVFRPRRIQVRIA